jgi:hypothetical protein
MPHATGLRLLAAINFFLCLTLILAPICAPLGVAFYLQARKKEKERSRELEALHNQ